MRVPVAGAWIVGLALSLTIVFGAGAAASAPLDTLALRLSDLRLGYRVVDAEYRVLTRVALSNHVPARQLAGHGWVSGYQALYEHRAGVTTLVGNNVDQFSSERGAHWWYEFLLSHVPAGYRPIATVSVGNESRTVENDTYVGVIFRRARYVVDVYLSLTAVLPVNQVIALARRVDQRLATGQPVRSAPTPTPGATRTPVPRGLYVTVQVIPNPIRHNTVALIRAQSALGAHCSAEVIYATGYAIHLANRARLPVDKHGAVSWKWRETTVSTGGTAYVRCDLRSATRLGMRPFLITR